MMDVVKATVEKNLLCWSAGHQLFCPCCSDILDWTTTVIVGSLVLCTPCFRQRTDKFLKQHDELTQEQADAWLKRIDVTSYHRWAIRRVRKHWHIIRLPQVKD